MRASCLGVGDAKHLCWMPNPRVGGSATALPRFLLTGSSAGGGDDELIAWDVGSSSPPRRHFGFPTGSADVTALRCVGLQDGRCVTLCGCADGQVHILWGGDSEGDSDGDLLRPLLQLQGALGGTPCCALAIGESPSLAAAASEGGSLLLFDVRDASQLAHQEDFEFGCITDMFVDTPSSTLWCGSSTGIVSRVDTRQALSKPEEVVHLAREECQYLEDRICCVAQPAFQPHKLCVITYSGAVLVTDTRTHGVVSSLQMADDPHVTSAQVLVHEFTRVMCGTAEGQLRDVVLRGESAAAERVLHEEKLGGVQAFCLDHDSDYVALINDYGQLTVMEDTPPPSMTL